MLKFERKNKPHLLLSLHVTLSPLLETLGRPTTHSKELNNFHSIIHFETDIFYLVSFASIPFHK